MLNSRIRRVVTLVVLSVLPLSDVASGRIRLAERSGVPIPILLHPRRFGREPPRAIDKVVAAFRSAARGTVASGAADFGKCSTPEIKFAVGLDGRKETAFAPVDHVSYNHGSADNIGVITQFICDALTNTCAANQAAKNLCMHAQTAANAATPLTGAQADAFNAVFGENTDFASVTPIDDTGKPVVGVKPASSIPVNPASSTTCPKPSATLPLSTGNLQTFAGSLGASAPAVTALGNGQFQVEGNSVFKKLHNALARSCNVQHNLCADAANASGNKGNLTVAACGTQQMQCQTAATV